MTFSYILFRLVRREDNSGSHRGCGYRGQCLKLWSTIQYRIYKFSSLPIGKSHVFCVTHIMKFVPSLLTPNTCVMGSEVKRGNGDTADYYNSGSREKAEESPAVMRRLERVSAFSTVFAVMFFIQGQILSRNQCSIRFPNCI